MVRLLLRKAHLWKEECQRARICLPETARSRLLVQVSQKSGQRTLGTPRKKFRTLRTLSNQATWFNRLGASRSNGFRIRSTFFGEFGPAGQNFLPTSETLYVTRWTCGLDPFQANERRFGGATQFVSNLDFHRDSPWEEYARDLRCWNCWL